jgi:hypothetical protein
MFVTDVMIQEALQGGEWLSARQIARRLEDLRPECKSCEFSKLLYSVRNTLNRGVVGVSNQPYTIPQTEETVTVYALL